jgi:hypothetical protein
MQGRCCTSAPPSPIIPHINPPKSRKLRPVYVVFWEKFAHAMRGSNCGYPFGSKSGYRLFSPRLATLGSGVTRVPVGPLEAGQQCLPAISQGKGLTSPLSAPVAPIYLASFCHRAGRRDGLSVLRSCVCYAREPGSPALDNRQGFGAGVSQAYRTQRLSAWRTRMDRHSMRFDARTCVSTCRCKQAP